MVRSLALIASFLFFSAAMPCLCVAVDGHHMPASLGVSGETCGIALSLSGEHVSQGALPGMNPIGHAASWRAFFSVLVGELFVVAIFAVLLRLVANRASFFLRILLIRRDIFRPPDRADDRLLVSRALFRALFSGVIHGKILNA